jgi:hypothetical protein
MSDPIVAVVTNDARKYWPMFFGMKIPKVSSPSNSIDPGLTTGGDIWNPLITCFRVGEGGWIDSGGSYVPRTPDPDLRRSISLTGFDGASYYVQDLDAVCDRTRSPADQRYDSQSRFCFQKSLTPADVTYDAGTYGPTTIRIKCLLETSECNYDDYSNPPDIWELGIFCAHPRVINTPPGGYPATMLMVAYCTFPVVTKTASIQFLRYVHITF